MATTEGGGGNGAVKCLRLGAVECLTVGLSPPSHSNGSLRLALTSAPAAVSGGAGGAGWPSDPRVGDRPR